MTETSPGGGSAATVPAVLAGSSDEIDTGDRFGESYEAELRAERVVALRACTGKQRAWLRKTMEIGGMPWLAAEKLGIGSASVHRWMRKEHIRRALRVLTSLAVIDLEISALRIQREYTRLAFSNIKDVYDEAGEVKSPSAWPEEVAAAVAEHSYDRDGRPTVRMHDKMRALDALARMRRLAGAERFELTGANGEPLAAPMAAVLVVPGLMPEADWQAAAKAQQQTLEGKEVSVSAQPLVKRA